MHGRRTSGFSLVEIMIVMAVISIIVAIAAPTWLRQREVSRARACQENLVKIDGAVEMYATEFRLSNGATLTFPDDLVDPGATGNANTGYLRTSPQCPSGGQYSGGTVGQSPQCDVVTVIDGYDHALL